MRYLLVKHLWKLLRKLSQPWRIVVSPRTAALARLIPDRLYLKCQYRSFLSEKLDLHHPSNYNEKLQWLKLYDRSSMYTIMVDKLLAKDYVAKRIGEQHIVPTLGVWDTFDEIDFNVLPNQFVLKCTHDSAGYVICKDKKTFDWVAAKKKITHCLSRNYYYSGREWVYKNVVPRILAEKYMEDNTFHELRDYKFFTFDGVPKLMHLVSNRQNPEETWGDFYDMEFNHLDLTMGHDNAPIPPEKPKNFEQMKWYAELLSQGTYHLRVDFYEVNGELFFGELTFYQDSGFADIQPKHWNKTLGSWIHTP